MSEHFDDPMEFIWEKIPKTKAGLVHYLPGDIPYLYLHGFVDSNRYGYQEWKDAFADTRQDDGSYLVSKEKFLTLRKFRYAGPVFKPFDPDKIREGEWSDEEIQKLFEFSFKPSCALIDEVFWNSINALKKQGFVNNGKLLVNKAVKTQLKFLIDKWPSPRRKLEQEVQRIREEREATFRSNTQNRDATRFTSGKLASEAKQEDFQKLQGASPKRDAPPPTTTAETIDIKSLRRPRGKITG